MTPQSHLISRRKLLDIVQWRAIKWQNIENLWRNEKLKVQNLFYLEKKQQKVAKI